MTFKRKHVTLSIKEKIEIIKSLEAGTTVTSLSKKYNVEKSTICGITKNKTSILSYGTTASSSLINKRKTLKLSAYPEVDKTVYTWFLQQRSRGVPISGEILCEKALFFYGQTQNDDNFKASSGWLDKFKNRYGIRQLSITGEKLSSDEAAVEPFKNEVEVIPGHVKHKEAVRSFETCLKWAEENDESKHHILILSEMKKRAKKAEEANIKQSEITEFFTVS